MTRKTSGTSLSRSLATATCALLGAAPTPNVHAQDTDKKWDFDTSVLFYSEQDDRVQDASVAVNATRSFADDRQLTLGLTVDTLTGASPSGAIAQAQPQTFTRPSGNSVYSVAANEIPLDDTFRDTRVAVAANWSQPLGRLYALNTGLSFSTEYDYTHAGLSASLARDFFRRNTTLSAGVAIARDEFDAVGGIPSPLTPMLEVGDLANRGGAQTKDIVDFILGVTQVLGRNTVVQVNYSFSDASGYLNDPYKIISIVDAVTGAVVPRVGSADAEGPSGEFIFESRPEQRTKHSLFAQAKHFLDGKVLDVSYRFMTDDWGIDSHTVDTRLRWPLGQTRYIEPHVRLYSQSQADFYTVSLPAGASLPAFASSDYRLGDFDAVTAGAKVGWKTRRGHDFSVRLEWYQQRGDLAPSLLVGEQPGLVTYPDLDAVIVQMSYRF